jgi:hypothetical protein
MRGPGTLHTALVLALASACVRPDDSDHDSWDLEALQDPQTCAGCHPIHYREWLGSMHAYAADDPVFRAMNARGQRETDGALGEFCVACHAPVAVALGLTEDGLDLDAVPLAQRGVTCWYCHQVDGIEGTHNNPLILAFDGLFRADLPDPEGPPVHGVERSALFSRDSLSSSAMCGSCHDIVTPAGAHIERTYAEWLASFYSDANLEHPDRPQLYGLTCNDCHMRRTTGPVADYPGAREDRDRHSHMFVGVDVAVSEFPDAELGPQLRAEQRAAIEEVRKTSLCASLCVREQPDSEAAEVTVWLHNEAAGHAWPSGATPDRRAWVELIARDEADAIVFESGVVGDDQAIAELDDPHLWLLRDRIFTAEGAETHMFWEAASYTSELLEVPSEFGADGHAQTWVARSYPIASVPASVELRVLLRPMGLEILADLVASGDLDPSVVEAFETFAVPPAQLEWTPETAAPSTGATDYGTCVSSSPGCGSPFLQ